MPINLEFSASVGFIHKAIVCLQLGLRKKIGTKCWTN